jgi:adenylosuccinate lyase
MLPLSPLDGRYQQQIEELDAYFSEEALLKARVEVELLYFVALSDEPRVRELRRLTRAERQSLEVIVSRFGARDLALIREFERRMRHDVKAVEEYLRRKLQAIPTLRKRLSFLHFGLTSEDVTNLAYGLLIHRAIREVLRPELKSLLVLLGSLGRRWRKQAMLSLTHGQPATPTTVGKEFFVFMERLGKQLSELYDFRMDGKFGGAVGTFAAHRAAYPEINWEVFGRKFVRSLGLTPLRYTTQSNPHDDLAELSHLFIRINTILLDCCRDCWLYIARGIFRQRFAVSEVGSSTMPHKVNPIDFENAEGNLGLSTALFAHFAEKLPVSRLQRDLSDSTVQRNLGVAFGHHLLAVRMLKQGLGKLQLDAERVGQELEEHPEILAEAIQTVMRRYRIEDAYEQLKKITRGEVVTQEKLQAFIAKLPIPEGERERLRTLVES